MRIERNAGRVWEEVRRTLARLFARAGVRDVPAGRMTVGVKVCASHATDLPLVDAGAQESAWRPQADTKRLSPPEAQDGGGGADLATLATVIGGNAALRPAGCPVHRVSVGMEGGGAVHAWDEALPKRSVPIAAPVAFDLVRTVPVSLLPGQIRSRRDQKMLVLSGGRSVPALGRLADIPMTRARLVSEDGFAAERAHLSGVSGVPVEDVALVGVYPRVPLAAVGHLAVGDDGNCLRLWLKPGALGSKPPAIPKLVTVLLGRQRSTGKTLQAVMVNVARPPL